MNPELCSKLNLSNPLNYIYLLELDKKQTNSLNSYINLCLKQRPELAKQYEKLTKLVLDIKAKQEQFKANNQKLIQSVFLREKILHIKIDHALVYSLLDVLRNHEDLVSLIYKAYLYLKIGNRGQVYKIIEQIVQSPPHLFIYNTKISELNLEERQVVIENLIGMLDILREHIPKKLFNNLVLYVSNFSQSKFSSMVIDLGIEDFSLNQIRELADEGLFGLNYPSVWYPLLLARTRLIEANQYLAKAFDKMLSNNVENNLWITMFHFPSEDRLRNRFLLFAKDTYNQDKVLGIKREIFVQLLDNPQIRSFLNKKLKGQIRPKFLIQKTLYLKCLDDRLSKGVHQYCLYQLAQLNYRFALD